MSCANEINQFDLLVIGKVKSPTILKMYNLELVYNKNELKGWIIKEEFNEQVHAKHEKVYEKKIKKFYYYWISPSNPNEEDCKSNDNLM